MAQPATGDQATELLAAEAGLILGVGDRRLRRPARSHRLPCIEHVESR
jgi:hypothetical protein